MKVDYWQLIGLAPAGGADAIMNAVSIVWFVCNRYLVILETDSICLVCM